MGEYGRGMYFVQSGSVEVFVKGGTEPLALLSTNAFFGEMALLDPEGRATGDVRVKGFCETFMLSRESFATLLLQFPDFKDYVENVAKLRLQKLDVRASTANLLGQFMNSPIKQRLIRQAGHELRARKRSVIALGQTTGDIDSNGVRRKSNQPVGAVDPKARWGRTIARASLTDARARGVSTAAPASQSENPVSESSTTTADGAARDANILA